MRASGGRLTSMLERNNKKPADYRARTERAASGTFGALRHRLQSGTHNQRDAEDQSKTRCCRPSALSIVRSRQPVQGLAVQDPDQHLHQQIPPLVLERLVAQSMERTGETGGDVPAGSGRRAMLRETLQFSLMSEAIHKALAIRRMNSASLWCCVMSRSSPSRDRRYHGVSGWHRDEPPPPRSAAPAGRPR